MIHTIEKLDSARIRQEKIHFTMHHNYVLQNISCLQSLGLWAYLTSLPENFKIHRSHLMEKFKIGRDKLSNCLKYLHENHLLEYIQDRNEKGIFVGECYISIKCGYDFEIYHRNLSTDNLSAPLKIRTTDYPVTGETAPIKIYINKNRNIKQKRGRDESAPKNPSLSLFEPDPQSQALSKELELSLEDELQSFKQRHKREKTQYEFQRWLKDSFEYKQRKITTKKQDSTIRPNLPWLSEKSGISPRKGKVMTMREFLATQQCSA